MTRAVEVRITGEVQGVSFRAYTVHEAVRLDLSGWVRNDPDGAVSARFEGDDRSVEEAITWCHAGAPGAHVTGVEVREVEPEGAGRFVVEY